MVLIKEKVMIFLDYHKGKPTVYKRTERANQHIEQIILTVNAISIQCEVFKCGVKCGLVISIRDVSLTNSL